MIDYKIQMMNKNHQNNRIINNYKISLILIDKVDLLLNSFQEIEIIEVHNKIKIKIINRFKNNYY